MNDNVMIAVDLMPKTGADLELLNSRAEKLAQISAQKQNTERQQYYLQFKLNAGLYGIPQFFLDEVIYPHSLVSLAWLPAFITGVISWKGKVLTVLDGNYLCTQQKITAINELSRIVVLTYQQQSIGLLVSEVCNFFDYKPSELKTSLQSPTLFNPEYFLGLLDYSIIFLNAEAIFNDSSLRVNHQH
jgi:purine-binding chemotaxis protein CheW